MHPHRILAFVAATAVLLALSLRMACGQAVISAAMVSGFSQSGAVVAPAWSPTNLSGAIGWWPSSSMITNDTGGVTNLPDLGPNGWSLTNLQLGATIPAWTNSSGTNAVVFTGDSAQFLTSYPLRVTSTSNEVVLVMKWTVPTNNQDRFVFDGTNSAANNQRMYQSSSAGGQFRFYAGSSVIATIGNTNEFMVVDVLFKSTDSHLFTNNVEAATGNCGTRKLDGLLLGNASTYVDAGALAVAELVIYDPALTAANRLTLFSYFTNKYAIHP